MSSSICSSSVFLWFGFLPEKLIELSVSAVPLIRLRAYGVNPNATKLSIFRACHIFNISYNGFLVFIPFGSVIRSPSNSICLSISLHLFIAFTESDKINSSPA